MPAGQVPAGQVPAGAAGRLVAVVVTFNRRAALAETLGRLLASPPQTLAAVVVVDNASTDGTAAFLADLAGRERRLVVLSCPENRGGAGGFALGIAHARDHLAPDWLVVMDDDARPEPEALERFHRLPLAGWDAIAAAVHLPDGRICEMNRPARNPFADRRSFAAALLRGREGFHLGARELAQARICPADVASFVGLFLSRRALALAGLPDRRLFIYADDGLYTLGLTQAGGRLGLAPQIRFEHACSTFGGAQRGRFRPLWKAYYYHRNLLLFYRRAAGPVLFWPVLAVIAPKWLWRARRHEGARRRFLGLLLRAFRDGISGRLDVAHGTVLAWAGEGSGGSDDVVVEAAQQQQAQEQTAEPDPRRPGH